MIDLSLESRILIPSELQRLMSAQKKQLESEFSLFLASLQPQKSLSSATPRDVVRFLIWKDSKGKTKVNLASCPLIGLQGKQNRSCPTRLSAGTVDSLIGKLRSIFNALGRTGDWDDHFGFENPASHLSVKQYCKSIQQELSLIRVSPKQATPIFLTSIRKLSTTLEHYF